MTVEIEAPAAGTLSGVSAAEGDDVPVGLRIAFILGDGEALPEPVAVAGPAAAGTAEVPADAAGEGAAVAAGLDDAGLSGNGASAPTPGASRRVLASPKARRLAQEHGVPIAEIAGSGPYGAVHAADVAAWAGSTRAPGAAVAASSPSPAAGEVLAVSSAWRTMAERMQHSWQEVPHFFLQRDVDASRLNSWRDAVTGPPRLRAGDPHRPAGQGLRRGARASIPRVNASWNGTGLSSPNGVNVGIAVATEDALIVPVVHDADRLGLREVAERRAELVARARDRKLRSDDVAGGTFTISNLGMFGVDAFWAIVNAPQAAILAVGRIADRVVAVDGAPAVRPTLTLTLSFDHRGGRRRCGRRIPRHARGPDRRAGRPRRVGPRAAVRGLDGTMANARRSADVHPNCAPFTRAGGRGPPSSRGDAAKRPAQWGYLTPLGFHP